VPTGRSRQLGWTPEALFAVGAVSQYLGASIAVHLFDRIDPAGVAWLRVLGAGVLVVAIRRPWRRRWTPGTLAWTAAFGISLALMNLCFYLAIDTLPLGNAVAFEFWGPIAVAAVGSRTRQSALALVLAVAGIALLSGFAPSGSAAGVAFAVAAGGAWAGYIVLGHRVARTGLAADGLGVGMLIGLVAIAPFGAPHLGPALDAPALLLAALFTGVLSNALPYVLDQVVLQRVDVDRFALLQSMLPVSATVLGFLLLSQRPSGGELVGIGLVAAALALRGRAALTEPVAP
jgi:inner membrane transporter RhtA